jgi:hypothetical protein
MGTAVADLDQEAGTAPLDETAQATFPSYSQESLERVAELEARGAELVGVIAAATAALVEVLAEAVRDELWRGFGIRSAEHWAMLRFGLSGPRARRLVAAARVLDDLPSCRDAFAGGRITEDHVAEVVRAGVTDLHDDQAVDLAQAATVSQLRRALSSLPAAAVQPGEDGDPASVAPATPPTERLATGFGDDGRWYCHGGADADRGAVIDRALQAARDRLWRSRHADREPTPADVATVSGIDALVHLAHLALDVADPETAAGRRPSERYLINVHLPAEDLSQGRLHLGPALPAWLTRSITCDADIRTWVETLDGNVNLGQRQPTVDPRLRTVVEERHGGCTRPGCDVTEGLHIHHVVHWADGGPTDLENLAPLCRQDHLAVHRGELLVSVDPLTGNLLFTDAGGRPIGPAPPTPPTLPPAQAAAELQLLEPRWENRSGERANWRYFEWLDPPALTG